MATPHSSGSASARPNASTPTSENNELEEAATLAGCDPERAPALAKHLGIGAGLKQVAEPRPSLQHVTYTAEPFRVPLSVLGCSAHGKTHIFELEVTDRRCWPQEMVGGFDHYGVTAETDVPVMPGDLVWLDIDSQYDDDGAEWMLARCSGPDTFVDVATGETVLQERNPSVHGRVIRQSWWMPADERTDDQLAAPLDQPDEFLRGPRKVTLTDAFGQSPTGGFWASAALYDCMSPVCPRGEWKIFQSGEGKPGDIVIADIEQVRREPFVSTTTMVIGRLGKDTQGRETVRSDSPGFIFTDGEDRNGLETHLAVWGTLVPYEVDCRRLNDTEGAR